MRLDYGLYTIAAIFFIITGMMLVIQPSPIGLWSVATVVLGLLFIVLGYSQRPPAATAETPQIPTAPATISQEEETETSTDTAALVMDLTEVRGIGQKRQEQLESIGILTVKQLINSSPEDLAHRLDISPKLTRKWIKNAKKLTEEY